MKILSTSQTKSLIQSLKTWISNEIASQLSTLTAQLTANRPETFTLTQAEYDALGDNLDPNAVYLIKEEA